jgi:D-alanyl-D-alanine carboxypeptidase (penicillin-binding protein 5/6)
VRALSRPAPGGVGRAIFAVMLGGFSRTVLAAGAFLTVVGSAQAAVPPPPPVTLHARAAILVEHDLGTTVYARRANVRMPVASETKLMTAYVALQRAPLSRVLKVRPFTAVNSETVAGLHAGQRLSVADLLAAMLLPSGADAAETLAVGLGGSEKRFVRWMNAAAVSLHLDGTHFTTEVGLDTPGNYSTAADLASLTATLLSNHFFAAVVARSRARLSNGQTVVNRNVLVGAYAFVVGVKTGHTRGAGYCLVAAGRRGGATVISVELGDGDERTRDADTLALLRYGLALYHGAEVVRGDRVYARLPVVGRPGERLALVAQHPLRLVVRRGSKLSVYPSSTAEPARGPLQKGTQLGTLTVKLDGQVVARVPLVSRSPLTAPPAQAAGRRILVASGVSLGLLLLVGCTLQVMLKRRGER